MTRPLPGPAGATGADAAGAAKAVNEVDAVASGVAVDAIEVTPAALRAAAVRSGIDAVAADRLWTALARDATAFDGVAPRPGPPEAPAASQAPAAPRFNLTHTLYYLGGMVAIGAATLFMTEGWRLLGPWGLLAVCVVYAAVCVGLARRLHRRGLEIPAGILATLAVCLVPLATWALQQGLGLWPEGGPERYAEYHTRIDWRWLTLEAVTLAAAAVALWALRYPFLTMPLAVTLWYLGMDLARLVVAPDEALAWTFYRDFSLFYGLAMALLAFWVDARSRVPGGSRRDYAFWLYLLGMITFWGALSSRESASELAKASYALLNLGFVFLGVLLQRRVFTVLGALGVAGYLGYLSARVFEDSLLFPAALTLIGLGVMAAGVWWQRHEARWQASLRRRAPAWLRGWLPPA
jgi:hypothetical protein